MNTSEKRKYIRIIAFLCFVCLVFGVASVVYAIRSDRYEFALETVSQKAANELCESLDSITVSLKKSLYSGTKEMLREIGDDLCRQATLAKESLSSLTNEGADTEDIFRFLSQVGNYTVFLSEGDSNLLTLSGKQRSALQALYNYAYSLSNGMNDIVNDYTDGLVSFNEKISTLNLDSSALPESFMSRIKSTKQTVTDYPTLLYDGPFADSILNKKALFLQDKKEITKNEAKAIAARIMGEKEDSLREDNDVNSEIELFCFSLGDKSISITKKGGCLCTLTDKTTVGAATISAKEAIKRSLEFLTQNGYKNMKDSYFSLYDGVCTVNFAYENDGIIYYSDLIKVGVSLETGKVVALDASGYLMNHTERELPEIKATEKGCENIISDSLHILSVRKAMIPLDTGKEALCYEFHCKDRNDSECLIYIDCETGKERDIMLLLYRDGGILTR